MAPEDQYGDDDEKDASPGGAGARFKEFDCPSCNANNPVDEPFGEGDQVLCNYCGTEYHVKVNEEGRLRLKEL